MNLNERISKVIEYSQRTSSEFADEIEVQRSSVSHITSGRNKPSLDFLIKVKDKFPELEWEWLISGNGEMLAKPETEPTLEEKSKNIFPDLFALVDDDQFGNTESEDKIQKVIPRESVQSEDTTKYNAAAHSQRLENIPLKTETQQKDSLKNKVKRIVLFYEDGKFESFEP